SACAACGSTRTAYACPRCGARVCALKCYDGHNEGRCARAFRDREAEDALRGERASDDAKEAMREVLVRRARGMIGSEGSASDDEGGRARRRRRRACALSEASLERLSIGTELDVDGLSEEERASFERALASGALFERWIPWWESAAAGSERASARGCRAVEVADAPAETSGKASESDIPPLASPSELLDPFEVLSGGREAPEALRWHCVNALAAYTLVKRVYNGDWRGAELEACETALELSAVLSAEHGAVPEAQCAADAVLDVVRRAAASLRAASTRELHASLLRDVLAVFTLGSSACVRAFLDLTRALDAADATSRARRRGASRRARVRAKARYLAAYLAATPDVARRV
ncbi:hypothetical protein BE221DRAFT_57574, partial [Ostreococcus tauri]